MRCYIEEDLEWRGDMICLLFEKAHSGGVRSGLRGQGGCREGEGLQET